jgi:hypothetical protein
MDTIRLLAIFAENKPGQLAHITGLLAQANINIRWVTIASTEAFGVIKLLVEDEELAYRQLKHSGVPVSLVEVLGVEVEDQPGTLFQVARWLAESGINVENASGVVFGKRAILLIEVSDRVRARQVLKDKGLRLLTANAMLQL